MLLLYCRSFLRLSMIHLDLTDLDNFTKQIETLQSTVESQLAQQQVPEEPIEENVVTNTEEEG